MSRLSELIAELCPDGVEYKALGEVGTFTKGRGLQKKDFSETGIGCIHYGQIYTRLGAVAVEPLTYVSPEKAPGFTWVEPNDIVIAVTSENVDDVCKAVVWRGKDSIVTGAHAVVFHPFIDSMYVAYYLQTHCFNQQKIMIVDGVKVIEMKIDRLAKVRIPVPPIEIQREIVRILDSFQELDDALTAEIEARKEILSACIDEMTVDAVPVENKADLIRMLERPITDGPHTTPQLVGEGIPFISAEAVSVGEGHIDFSHKRGFITRAFHEECCKKYKPKRNDVYMVKSGSTTGRVAMVETDEEFNIWSPLAAMRVNEANSARYLFYLLQSHDVQRQVGLHCSQGSQPNLGMRRLERFRVRIPTLSYQLNAVDSLDAIQTLIDSLRSERDARRKQFAYYRDKLLDLPEKVTTNG